MQDEGDREVVEPESGPSKGGPNSFTAPEEVERRVWRNIFIVIAVSVLSAAVFASLKSVFGLIIGGMLALLNYRWLHSSLRGVLASGEKKAPSGTTLKFIFRWVVIASAVYGANLTGYINPLAMLLGLFTPALAIMMEAVYVTYKTLTERGE